MKTIFQLDDNIETSQTKSLWVFGYGSLCWRPGFEFDKAVVGHIKGFSRKFWQGNDVHRGTEEKPGRVATLVEDNESTVHGIAFAISGEAAISYLSQREVKLGGYDTKFTTFYPLKGAPIRNILLYVATPANSLWLGDAPISNIANEIIETKGICGYNVEYLLRLADFMRRYCPDVEDSHLFNLEAAVMTKIRDKKMCLTTMMGDAEITKELVASNSAQAYKAKACVA
ncbi:hypothetical protein Trydic_g11922 [Trypoxylus dichotomus]